MEKVPFTSKVSRAEFTKLKSNFVWGAATSACQIEGAASEGGRSPSIWDKFAIENPSIFKDDNRIIGVNAYYKIKEDVQMMKKMGLNAYRFSISWSRILPGGTLEKGVNKEGVDYYNNLINELKSNQIEPYATLWHWDTPNCLEEEYQGFLNERIVHDFKAYAELCFREFGDRVVNWITFNEPANYAEQGYDIGAFAPGRTANSTTEPYIVAHNILICHATVVELYRQRFKETQEARIGITLDSIYFEPLHPGNEEDKVACLRAIDFHFGWFLKPLVTGEYPKSMEENVGDRLPKFTKEQAKLLKGSCDFLGLNYYVSYYATTGIANGEGSSCAKDSNVIKTPIGLDGKGIGDKGGVIWFYSYPAGLQKLLRYIKETYDDPVIIITENGWPDQNDNSLKIEEACHDEKRINYYDEHIQSVLLAMKAEVKVEGYFAWSLLDNFEWNFGYSVRFGIIYVDYNDGKYTRHLKDSAMWFENFLK